MTFPCVKVLWGYDFDYNILSKRTFKIGQYQTGKTKIWPVNGLISREVGPAPTVGLVMHVSFLSLWNGFFMLTDSSSYTMTISHAGLLCTASPDRGTADRMSVKLVLPLNQDRCLKYTSQNVTICAQTHLFEPVPMNLSLMHSLKNNFCTCRSIFCSYYPYNNCPEKCVVFAAFSIRHYLYSTE